MADKKFYEMTNNEMIANIKAGLVKHRRCDVCGCELAIPDIGVFSRKGLNTVACTNCTNTKYHHDLLLYVEELKKSHTKDEVLEILEKRLNETWGEESSIFTIEGWEEQTRKESNV